MTPYLLHIDGEYYPILREGFNITHCAGAKGKHSVSSARCSIRSVSLLQKMATFTKLVDAYITDSDGTRLFTGVVRPSVSLSVDQINVGNVEIELLDVSEKFHKKVYAKLEDSDIEYEDGTIFETDYEVCYVCNPSEPEKSILHILLKLAGVEIPDDIPEINYLLYAFSLKEGSYLDDVLFKVLYEYSYDCSFDEYGKIHIFQSGSILPPGGNAGDVINIPVSRTIDVFRNSLNITRDDEVVSGVLVEFPKHETKENVVIYEDSGESWPGLYAHNDYWWVKQDEEITWTNKDTIGDDIKSPIWKNFWFGFSDESWGAASTSLESSDVSGGQNKCTASWRVAAIGGALFAKVAARIKIYADVEYLTDRTQIIGFAGENAEKYTASYLQEYNSALSFAQTFNTREKYGSYRYTFSSFDKIDVGSVVNFEEPIVAGISSLVRITSRTVKDETKLYQYEAEGYSETAFSEPSISKDNSPSQPQDSPDFFRISIDEDMVVEDEEDFDEPIVANAFGMVFDKYGAIPSWSVNNVVQAELKDKTVKIQKSLLSPGSNIISCSVTFNGEEYRLDKKVKFISSDISAQMQYTVCKEGEEPDASSIWTDGQPDPGKGEVVWMRFRMNADSEWIVLKWSASDGGNPILYFQWAATPYVRPDEGYDLLGWNKTALTWQVGDGKVLGFVANHSNWSQTVPTERPTGLNYLWVKYYNYLTDDWEYFCTTGTPAMSFDLEVNPSTYKLTSRGVTLGDEQKIIAMVHRINTTAPCTWTIGDEASASAGVTWRYINETSDTEIEITIPAFIALESLNIHCSIADIELGKDFVVSGIQEGKADMMYLGVYDSLAELQASTASGTSEGPLQRGDSALVDGEPYYYTGSEWVFADGDCPRDITSKILPQMLNDALASPNVKRSESIINLFVKNIVAENLDVVNGDMRVAVGSNGNLPNFQITYKNEDVLNILPSDGSLQTQLFQLFPKAERTITLTIPDDDEGAEAFYCNASNIYTFLNGKEVIYSNGEKHIIKTTIGTESLIIYIKYFEDEEEIFYYKSIIIQDAVVTIKKKGLTFSFKETGSKTIFTDLPTCIDGMSKGEIGTIDISSINDVLGYPIVPKGTGLIFTKLTE